MCIFLDEPIAARSVDVLGATMIEVFSPVRCQRLRSAFTLMEVLLAVMILGIGFTAAMQLFLASTLQNQSSVKRTIATNLANNIQELMASAAYSDNNGAWGWGLESGETLSASNTSLDLDDFDNATFNPPIDARWRVLDGTTELIGGQQRPKPNLSQYTQKIVVECVKHTDFSTVVADTADQGVRRITVTISFKLNATTASQDVYTLVFYRFNDKKAIAPGET